MRAMIQILNTVRLLLLVWKMLLCVEGGHAITREFPDDYEDTMPESRLAFAERKTVCPFEVKINRNENRWPIEIKEIKCIPQPKQLCCSDLHECTQLVDMVLFYNRHDRSDTWRETVYVGCVCMKKSQESVLSYERPKIGS